MVTQCISAGAVMLATRLMQLMGIEALYRKPKTTQRHPGHKAYPYLLWNLAVTRPNQVWAMEITYLPVARGTVYLRLLWIGTPGACFPGRFPPPFRYR